MKVSTISPEKPQLVLKADMCPSLIIKLGEIPEDIDTSNGEGIPGFTAMTMMTAFLIAGWIQGRRRLENQS